MAKKPSAPTTTSPKGKSMVRPKAKAKAAASVEPAAPERKPRRATATRVQLAVAIQQFDAAWKSVMNPGPGQESIIALLQADEATCLTKDWKNATRVHARTIRRVKPMLNLVSADVGAVVIGFSRQAKKLVKAGKLPAEKAKARSGKADLQALLGMSPAEAKLILTAGIPAAAPVSAPVEEDDEEQVVYTEETLAELDPKALRELVAELGVEPEGKKRSDYVTAILSAYDESELEDEDPEVEAEEAEDFEDEPEEGPEVEEEGEGEGEGEELSEDDNAYWEVENLKTLSLDQLKTHAKEYAIDISGLKGKSKIAAHIAEQIFEE